MKTQELKEICDLVVRLTELRQEKCKYLCIENFAPELLGKLLTEYLNAVYENTIRINIQSSLNI